jgi:Protein of unknown function (DUF4232)
MRALETIAPGLVLLSVLAACGDSGDSPAPTGAGATTAASVPATAAGGATPAKPSDGPGTSGAACTTKDVEVTITAQPGGSATTQRGLVAVTNTAKQPCTLNGWLTITLVNAADEPVGVPTETVEEPGPAEDVTIPPGTTAFAGIKWAACDKADADCGVGNTIRYDLRKSKTGPAAKLDGFPDAEKSGITMKSLQIGSLQPATQGVVAW